MLGKLYEGQNCSVARTLEVVGERWSLLIIRNAMFLGMTRFMDFQRSLGIAPNILTKRLGEFVESGLMDLRPRENGRNAEYVLTPKGRDLQPVVMALSDWGDRWAPADGPPVTYTHDDCGGHVVLRATCERCGKDPAPDEVLRGAPSKIAEPAEVAGRAR